MNRAILTIGLTISMASFIVGKTYLFLDAREQVANAAQSTSVNIDGSVTRISSTPEAAVVHAPSPVATKLSGLDTSINSLIAGIKSPQDVRTESEEEFAVCPTLTAMMTLIVADQETPKGEAGILARELNTQMQNLDRYCQIDKISVQKDPKYRKARLDSLFIKLSHLREIVKTMQVKLREVS